MGYIADKFGIDFSLRHDVRARPGDRLTLRFDCKPCEMHVVGAMRESVLKKAVAQPVTFYRAKPAGAARGA